MSKHRPPQTDLTTVPVAAAAAPEPGSDADIAARSRAVFAELIRRKQYDVLMCAQRLLDSMEAVPTDPRDMPGD